MRINRFIAALALPVLLCGCQGGEPPAEEGPKIEMISNSSDVVQAKDNSLHELYAELSGDYGLADRAIQTKVNDNGNVSFEVLWLDDRLGLVHWTMSGHLDRESLSVEYTDCTKTMLSQKVGEESSSAEEVAYHDGTGRFQFDREANTLQWEDDQEQIAKGMLFSHQDRISSVSIGTEGLEILQTESTDDHNN